MAQQAVAKRGLPTDVPGIFSQEALESLSDAFFERHMLDVMIVNPTLILLESAKSNALMSEGNLVESHRRDQAQTWSDLDDVGSLIGIEIADRRKEDTCIEEYRDERVIALAYGDALHSIAKARIDRTNPNAVAICQFGPEVNEIVVQPLAYFFELLPGTMSLLTLWLDELLALCPEISGGAVHLHQ